MSLALLSLAGLVEAAEPADDVRSESSLSAGLVSAWTMAFGVAAIGDARIGWRGLPDLRVQASPGVYGTPTVGVYFLVPLQADLIWTTPRGSHAFGAQVSAWTVPVPRNAYYPVAVGGGLAYERQALEGWVGVQVAEQWGEAVVAPAGELRVRGKRGGFGALEVSYASVELRFGKVWG